LSVAIARRPWNPPEEHTVRLRDVLATVRRQKWSVLGVTLLVTALAASYSFTRTPIYSSTAEVLVRPTLTSPVSTVSHNTLSLQTEARLATSATVAGIARSTLGWSADTAQLLERVSVTVPAETEVLQITYRDTDPARAQRGAQAFAEAYLQFKYGQAKETVAQYTTSLQTQISELDTQIQDQNRTISQLAPNSQGWLDALRELDLLQARRISLQEELATATTLSVDPGQIIQPAPRPRAPVSPKHGFDIAMGLFFGLFGGIGVAVARERYRDGVTDADVFEQSLGAPALGVVPRLGASMRRSAQLVTLTEPRSPMAEAYRTLRTNLLAANNRPSPKTILVTSAQMGEGKTTTAANLAVSLTLLGKEVVLISADLRRPRIHDLFGMQSDQGLSQVLAGELSIADSVRHSGIPHLRVLTSGSVSTLLEPAELLQSDRMLEVLAYCKEAEFVVIDGPPVRGIADSLALAGMVDGVIVVADARKGTRASVATAAYQLDQVGGRVIGGVLNGFAPARSEDRYGSYEDRSGLVSRLLSSGPSDRDGHLTHRGAPLADAETPPSPKGGTPSGSAYRPPSGKQPREATSSRPAVDRAGNGAPAGATRQSGGPGADRGSTS
jgi:succinoglycan biosynthesis transport protein ExoP